MKQLIIIVLFSFLPLLNSYSNHTHKKNRHPFDDHVFSTDLGGGGNPIKSKFITMASSILDYLETKKQTSVDISFLREILADETLSIIVVDKLLYPNSKKEVASKNGLLRAWGAPLFIQLKRDFEFIPKEIFHELLRASSVYSLLDDNYDITVKLGIDKLSFNVNADDLEQNKNPYSLEKLKYYSISHYEDTNFSLYQLIYLSKHGILAPDPDMSFEQYKVYLKSHVDEALKHYNDLHIMNKVSLKAALYKSISCLAGSRADEIVGMEQIYDGKNSREENLKIANREVITIGGKCKEADKALFFEFNKTGFHNDVMRHSIYKILYIHFLEKEYKKIFSVKSESSEEWEALSGFLYKHKEQNCGELSEISEVKEISECLVARKEIIGILEAIGLGSFLQRRIAIKMKIIDMLYGFYPFDYYNLSMQGGISFFKIYNKKL